MVGSWKGRKPGRQAGSQEGRKTPRMSRYEAQAGRLRGNELGS